MMLIYTLHSRVSHGKVLYALQLRCPYLERLLVQDMRHTLCLLGLQYQHASKQVDASHARCLMSKIATKWCTCMQCLHTGQVRAV